jgi:hypothetical protein
VSLVIAFGVALRLHYLDVGPLWVDEAESSINALTILQYGYPVDHYLGLPIFENTLVKPWPGHPEYEFKDLSYSNRGLAIYHGWLPLYSIAASFAAYGIRPDQVGASPPPPRDLEELKRRTRAARLPAVIFAALFLAVCYIAGATLYGRDAGATALIAAAVLSTHIEIAIQARYYSALVTVSTLAGLMLWLMLTKGGWKHYLIGAGAFLLLFFTHLVTFAAALSVLAVFTPVLVLRGRPEVWKLTAFGLILSAGIVPWVIATGFLSGLGAIPPARAYLKFPGDLLLYPIGGPASLVLFAVFALLILFAFVLRSRLPRRFVVPFEAARLPVICLSTWIVAAYFAFLLLIPAVSLDETRLKLCFFGPKVLLVSVFCAAAARIVSRRFSIMAASGMALLLLIICRIPLGTVAPQFATWKSLTALTQYLGERIGSTANTRFYAKPNSHLVLSFYTGLPFQSIAPIRRSFLDRYEGEIVYIDVEDSWFGRIIQPDRLRRAAAASGENLSEDSAEALSLQLRSFDYREEMKRRILGGEGRPERIPSYAWPLLEQARTARRAHMRELSSGIIFRGYRILDWFDWVGVFYYRFVDVESRLGPHLNYANRLRYAQADVLTDGGWVIYRARREGTGSLSFRLLP